MSNAGSISTGWKAAQTTAEALNKGKPNEEGLVEYFEWYDKNYFGPAGRKKQGGRDFTIYLTPEDLDYLTELPDETFPQTMDIFKVVNCIGKCYSEKMTRIYEERPDVMDRMVKVRENMDEDMQKRVKWGFRNV